MNVIIGTIALFSTLTSSLTNNNTAYSDETSTEKDSLPGAIPDLTQACANRIVNCNYLLTPYCNELLTP